MTQNLGLTGIYPRIVRGYYYMENMSGAMYCIEISGSGTPGDGDVLREDDGKPIFFLLDGAQKYLKGE